MDILIIVVIVAFSIYLAFSADKLINKREVRRREKQALKRLNKLKEKYDPETAKKIFNQDFWIGMTKDQVIDSIGKPINGVKEHNSKGVTDKWNFNGATVYFQDDKAVKIIEDPTRVRPRLMT